jgi:hypothetical protein
VNFQVSILKVLSSYPNGVATHAQLKRDVEILATSGRDWAIHSKRLAAEFPSLDIFSLKLVERYSFGWRLTKKGFIMVEMMGESVRRPTQIGRETLSDGFRQPKLARVHTLGGSCAATVPLRVPRLKFTVIEGGKTQAA